MNKKIYSLLCSPLTKEKLIYNEENEVFVACNSRERFNLLNGIPILITSNCVSDYCNNVLEILYKDKTKSIEDDFNEISNKLLDDFSKENIIIQFINYSKMDLSNRLEWFIKKDENYFKYDELIADGYKNATYETGKSRVEITKKMKESWAIHLNDYAKLVNESRPKIILELATGAGLGTVGVIESGLDDSTLITIDIDYACVSNALGIAKYLNLNNIVPIVANFWFLPFRNDSIDLICTHYGLDESREIGRVIEEVSRVLKRDGQFILVTRKDPTIRLKQTLEGFKFNDDEYVMLARLAGLFSGKDDLINLMDKHHFKLDYIKEYSPINSHERILYRFIKI